jgi:cobyrinic acid a,c-diamide synthase
VTRALVIAGVASGVGKTSITLGLLEAYRRRGLTVQPFKVGPDFIDPGFHRLATGRASYNLDGWMCGRERVVDTFRRSAAGADLAIVEGVMGCFDGVGERGSTAEIAKWLGVPVVLVVDVAAQSRSAAAIVLGFERFDRALDMAGVILNRAGGERHVRDIETAIATSCRTTLLGALRWDETLTFPERHLGLVTAMENTSAGDHLARLGDAVERAIDLDRLLAIAKPIDMVAGGGNANDPATAIARDGDAINRHRGAVSASAGTKRAVAARPRVVSLRATIGIALDAAFQFYYEENLDALRRAGADLVYWSPLGASKVPAVDGLYLGGGYPELHARRLAANGLLLQSLRQFAASGRPIYAECGGLMLLADALEDLDGVEHRMVGLLPATVRMRPRRLTLAYVDVTFAENTPLGPAGTHARGHEFHSSTLDPVPDAVPRAWRLEAAGGDSRAEGYRVGGTLMSYAHLHFASCADLAPAFVDACARARTAASPREPTPDRTVR